MKKWNYYNEIDPFCVEWLGLLMRAGLIPEGVIDDRSIEDVVPAELAEFRQCHFFAGVGIWALSLRAAGWPDDRKVWTGSPPCQPYSSAGKRLTVKDERHLFPSFFRLIKARRPPVVLGEQVASSEVVGTKLEADFVDAVRSGDFARANRIANKLVKSKSLHYWNRWLDLVHREMGSAGYAFRPEALGAHSAGAPQIRQRIFFLAETARSGSCGELEIADDARSSPSEVRSEQSGLSDAISSSSRARDVADADGRDTGTERKQSGGQQRLQPPSGGVDELAHSEHGRQTIQEQRSESRRSGDDGVAQGDTVDQRLERLGGDERDGDEPGRFTEEETGSIAATGESSFWSDAEWIWCRDEKYRAVEPGTFPLVNGIPARVGPLVARLEQLGVDTKTARRIIALAKRNRIGRLRGYGNAIVAPLATEFIKTSLEVLGERY